MANIIGTKQYLVQHTFNKHTGRIESKIVKSNSSDYKIKEKMMKHIETSQRYKRNFGN